jgi:hypothetical protein
MPTDQLVNPAGLYTAGTAGGPVYTAGETIIQAIYDPAQAGNLVNGNCVSLEPVTAPATGPVMIKKSTTTADSYVLGIVVGAPTGGYVPGSNVQVQVLGLCLCLFAATTVAGNYALQGTGTAGTLMGSATATSGITLGTILSAVTIAAGTALVPVYLDRT